MAIKDNPDTIRAMVGETIAGVIQDNDASWWLIVQSGHALVFGGNPNGARGVFWVSNPDDVKQLIARRRKDISALRAEMQNLTLVDEFLEKHGLS
jgi:hypothetical protein